MKNVETVNLLENVGMITFGRSRKECLETETCIKCGGEANMFRDEKSLREWRISALCNACQDEVFGTDEENSGLPFL